MASAVWFMRSCDVPRLDRSLSSTVRGRRAVVEPSSHAWASHILLYTNSRRSCQFLKGCLTTQSIASGSADYAAPASPPSTNRYNGCGHLPGAELPSHSFQPRMPTVYTENWDRVKVMTWLNGLIQRIGFEFFRLADFRASELRADMPRHLRWRPGQGTYIVPCQIRAITGLMW